MLGLVRSLILASSGWTVLSPSYQKPSVVDGFTFEWQYFMIHDKEKAFTGSLGFVLVDPRYRLDSVLPSGPSVAIAGQWADGSQFAEYEHLDGLYQVNDTSKNFRAEGKDQNEKHFAYLDEEAPVSAEGGRMRLQGRTAKVAYDLVVESDWTERNSDKDDAAFGPVRGDDMGYLPGEHWTVHMQWPRTKVRGRMTDLGSGKSYDIDGHGYRENSWGRWNFAVDGWAFSVLSDAQNEVQFAWQSYHKSNDMDWVDLSFPDQGQIQKRRFHAKEKQLRWQLKDWTFDKQARQCVPQSVSIEAADDDYRVRVSYDLHGKQIPMLSSATALTKIFVIMIHMPYMRGTIENVRTGEILRSFEGQGGGEFSATRSIWPSVSAPDCERWGQRYNR